MNFVPRGELLEYIEIAERGALMRRIGELGSEE